MEAATTACVQMLSNGCTSDFTDVCDRPVALTALSFYIIMSITAHYIHTTASLYHYRTSSTFIKPFCRAMIVFLVVFSIVV